MLVFACLEWDNQNYVCITMVGYHEVLVLTSCRDWESTYIVSADFIYVQCVHMKSS